MPERVAHWLTVYCGDGECSGHSLSVGEAPWMIREQSDKSRLKREVKETQN